MALLTAISKTPRGLALRISTATTRPDLTVARAVTVPLMPSCDARRGMTGGTCWGQTKPIPLGAVWFAGEVAGVGPAEMAGAVPAATTACAADIGAGGEGRLIAA